jgi:hypothetical protein
MDAAVGAAVWLRLPGRERSSGGTGPTVATCSAAREVAAMRPTRACRLTPLPQNATGCIAVTPLRRATREAPRGPNRASAMIRKLKSGEFRIYSRQVDRKTGKRRNLGTFPTREAAEKHEREIQYFKRH